MHHHTMLGTGVAGMHLLILLSTGVAGHASPHPAGKTIFLSDFTEASLLSHQLLVSKSNGLLSVLPCDLNKKEEMTSGETKETESPALLGFPFDLVCYLRSNPPPTPFFLLPLPSFPSPLLGQGLP